MKKKEELDLSEILKGHKGEMFYSPCYGEVILDRIFPTGTIVILNGIGGSHILWENGAHPKSNAQCMLFPSKQLYEKYPLDAKAAWAEWLEE